MSNSKDYDKNGNRINPYRSIHLTKKQQMKNQYKDKDGYWHLNKNAK